MARLLGCLATRQRVDYFNVSLLAETIQKAVLECHSASLLIAHFSLLSIGSSRFARAEKFMPLLFICLPCLSSGKAAGGEPSSSLHVWLFAAR